MSELLSLRDITKSYQCGHKSVPVLQSLHMSLQAGELASVVGPSGSGKTTLLNIIGGMDQPDSGNITFRGQDTRNWRATHWDRFRQKEIGYIFQFNQLLGEFTALENVWLKCLIAGVNSDDGRTRAMTLLDRLGLGQRLHHRPNQLSGGEQQRVAIARALVVEPALILADEPTGNLDAATGDRIFDLLCELQSERQIACLLVTHNPGLSQRCDRIIQLEEAQNTATKQGDTDV
ncbi:MAG: ABC transporter ATP-binding protein [Acidobacteria bacterium]|nr:ABC transporter ATP-binding protein [Acidobacteriota bacterium]